MPLRWRSETNKKRSSFRCWSASRAMRELDHNAAYSYRGGVSRGPTNPRSRWHDYDTYSEEATTFPSRVEPFICGAKGGPHAQGKKTKSMVRPVFYPEQRKALSLGCTCQGIMNCTRMIDERFFPLGRNGWNPVSGRASNAAIEDN